MTKTSITVITKRNNNTNTGDDSHDADDDGSNDNEYNQYTLQQTLGVTNAS